MAVHHSQDVEMFDPTPLGKEKKELHFDRKFDTNDTGTE